MAQLRPVAALGAVLALVAVLGAEKDTPVNIAARARVTGPKNASGSVGRPDVVTDNEVGDYGPSHGYAWAYLPTPLVVDLGGERTVALIELLLLDTDSRGYRYRIETSLDGESWEPAADRTDAWQRGWQRIAIEPRPCRFLKVTFTRTSLSVNSYHVVELAAYETAPAGETALFRRHKQARKDRMRTATDALDIAPAVALLSDAETRERLARLPERQPRGIDSDHDGRPELICFRDGRHLIVALDDDGDASFSDLKVDEDSDCLAVDYGSDGSVDRVIDRVDTDNDGDVDEVHLYYLGGGFFGRRHGLVVIWDFDDDNQTWRLINYQYDQGSCQWDCDFGGDEAFCMFHRDAKTGEWIGNWENPFCFYDPDKDGLPEVAVRYEGHASRVSSVRYSINADNDWAPGFGYDYDVAVISFGPVEIPAEEMVTAALRGGETGAFVPWQTARQVAASLPWKRALLVWDENDRNVAPRDTHERWEGIINSAYRDFPQVGGPPCGRVNKRYELDADLSGSRQLYWSPVDQRLHLFGAEVGTYQVDADGNGRLELIVETQDRDGDGFFDRWQFDDDADGKADREVEADGKGPLRPMAFDGLAEFYVPRLAEALDANVALCGALGEDTGGWRQAHEHAERGRFEWENRRRAAFAAQMAEAQQRGQATRLERLLQAREAADSGRLEEARGILDAEGD